MRDGPHPEIELTKTDFLRFLREFKASDDMQRAAAQESSFLAFYERDHGPVVDNYGEFHLWLLDTLGFKKEARKCRLWRRDRVRELEKEAPQRPPSRDDPDWMLFRAQVHNVECGGLLADQARTAMILSDHPTLTAVPGRILQRLRERDDRRQRRLGPAGWVMLVSAALAALFSAATVAMSYPWGRRLLHVPDPTPATAPTPPTSASPSTPPAQPAPKPPSSGTTP